LKKVTAIHLRYLWNFKVAKTNQRLYNGLTSFPKDLRKFLFTYNKETRLPDYSKIEIDGSNTQPVLICIEMKNSGVLPDIEFEELCFNGKLYDKIAKDLNVERSEIKARFMDTLLFTANNSEHVIKYKNPNENNFARQEFALYMKETFPITYKWLLDTKHQLSNSFTNPVNRDNPGGSELAKRIQSMEANMWIHEFLKTLPDDMIYFTIHDSIMLFQPTPETEKLCIDKLLEVSRKMYNVEIPYKIKRFPEDF
jgi:hypothetical protein